MIRQHALSGLITTTAFALLLGTLSCMDGVAVSAPESKSSADNEKDPAKTPPADFAALAAQVKELQKQVAESRALQTPRIVAAGTATYRRPKIQDNTAVARVKLKADIAAKLGEDYIVLITNRYPTGGYPYFSAYWKRTKDGFDIAVVDIALNWGTTAEYTNKNNTYLIDWIVVYDPTMAARSRQQGGPSGPPPGADTLPDADVLVTVLVPASATVWVNGDKSTQTGSRREFTSSGLTPGKTYTYTIRARWEEAGIVIDLTQNLPVQGGKRHSIDFLALPRKPLPKPDGGN